MRCEPGDRDDCWSYAEYMVGGVESTAMAAAMKIIRSRTQGTIQTPSNASRADRVGLKGLPGRGQACGRVDIAEKGTRCLTGRRWAC